MKLESLYLYNFRNFKKALISFGPRVNLISGKNGQGKTNLLEALYFLSTGRSFKTPHLKELIREGQPHFYIEAVFTKEGMKEHVSAFYDGKTRQLKINGTTYSHFTNLIGLLPFVLMASQDISLLMGPPAERRRFLDLHIAQEEPLYVHHLSRYVRAMMQRNRLLSLNSLKGIEPWEKEMETSAHFLSSKREEAVCELTAPITQAMQLLSSGRDIASIEYKRNAPLSLSEELKKNRGREIKLGFTLVGPHRDDLFISIHEKSAKLFSSEGQKRSCIAAFRLAEWQRLKIKVGSAPLLGIDDFGVHLDLFRIKVFHDLLKECGQVFLTSPEFDEKLFATGEVHQYSVENGEVSC